MKDIQVHYTRLRKHANDSPLTILKVSPNLSHSQMLKTKSLACIVGNFGRFCQFFLSFLIYSQWFENPPKWTKIVKIFQNIQQYRPMTSSWALKILGKWQVGGYFQNCHWWVNCVFHSSCSELEYPSSFSQIVPHSCVENRMNA